MAIRTNYIFVTIRTMEGEGEPGALLERTYPMGVFYPIFFMIDHDAWLLAKGDDVSVSVYEFGDSATRCDLLFTGRLEYCDVEGCYRFHPCE